MPVWISFTLDDLEDSRIRSGETVDDAVRTAVKSGASAILFNCCKPETMAPAISTTVSTLQHLDSEIPIGVYANAFPVLPQDAQANAELNDIRQDIAPADYLNFATYWISLGATIIGGCCGIGPEHIAAIHASSLAKK